MNGDAPLGADDRALCLALGSFLRAVAQLALLGLLFTGLALLAGMQAGVLRGWALLALLSGLAERMLALRLAFDARLFAALAEGGLPTLGRLDQALAGLGLRAAGARSRGLPERIRGTRRLVLQHAAVLALQALLVGVLLWRGGAA